MLDHADGAVEHSHQMRRGFTLVVGQLQPVLLAHGDQEPMLTIVLVDGHGGVDGDLAAKVVFDLVGHHCSGRVVANDLGQALDPHLTREYRTQKANASFQ